MKITATVMAHPSRMTSASVLFHKLRQMPFEAVKITWDKKNDEWDTGKRSLEFGLIKDAEWHIVIQDDAILCSEFYNNLVKALQVVPSKSLVSLYTGKPRPLEDRIQEAIKKASLGEWLISYQLYWGVGIAIPTKHIQRVLDFVDKIELPYDNKIGEFYSQNALPVYYTYPSLVDHDDDLGTLIEGHGVLPGKRVCYELANSLLDWKRTAYFI